MFSVLISTVDHRRCNRMVARLRHLGQQSRLLHWAPVCDLHSRYVLVLIVHDSCVQSSDSPNVSGLVAFHQPPGVVQTTALALLEVYNPYLAVFAMLSLATNVLATSLIAYKAWYVEVVPFSHVISALTVRLHTLKQGTQTVGEEILLGSWRQVTGPKGPRFPRRVR